MERKINNSARDIKRKIELVKKACAKLKELGVSMGVAYSAARTNGLYLFGDHRITRVIDLHRDEILLNDEWMDDSDHDESGTDGQVQPFILPPLPAPLHQLNGLTLKTMLTGVVKDLGLTWQSDKPSWWPDEYPSRHPRTQPKDYRGENYRVQYIVR